MSNKEIGKMIQEGLDNGMMKVKMDLDEKTGSILSTYLTRDIEATGQLVKGVSKDEPSVVNEQGGSQSRTLYDFTLADPKAMFEMTKVLKEGADKYGRENWRLISVQDHINHLLIHAYAYLAGDKSDDHLSHIMCRALFAQGVAVQTAEDIKSVLKSMDGVKKSDHDYSVTSTNSKLTAEQKELLDKYFNVPPGVVKVEGTSGRDTDGDYAGPLVLDKGVRAIIKADSDSQASIKPFKLEELS